MTTAEQTTTPAIAPAASQSSTGETPMALRVSEALRRFVDFVGRWGSLMIIPVVFFTMVDVVARKIHWLDEKGNLHGLQVWLVSTFGRTFESTMLQELEWHFHAALFALVLGYGYIKNSHVRVDLIRENLAFRNRAWVEFWGITLFMIPFCVTIIWFAWGYTRSSYLMNEISASTVGLTHRWIIKSVLLFGLITALAAAVSVWLQVAVALFGDPARRFPLMTLEWPEEDMKIEGKERVKLDDAMDALAAPDEELRARTSKILTG